MNNQHVVSLKKAGIFQNQQLILTDVNLEIKKGELVYLIGKTGSGKSSLLKTLYGELPLKTGNGHIAGFDLNTLEEKDIPFLRRRLGIVFQDFNLLMDRNVEDNLLFVLQATGWKDKEKMNIRISEVLQRVGLKTKNLSMPFELSGGEQQRVVIARALLNRPQIILADEPTGNLDPETSDTIILLLLDLCKELETSILLATHDYYMLERFPARIVRCQNGRLMLQEGFEV